MNPEANPLEEVYEWLELEAKRQHIDAKIYPSLVRRDDNWLYLPVHIEGGDLFEKAEALYNLEEAWRAHQPRPYWELLLIPAIN